ncbi:MAG: beta-glucosidase [Actinobacteria bacterium]|nr:beta-glucosidase [Actinomycetota bacterium]
MTAPSPLPHSLPHGIRWSAATAAFQIEGARTEGGRGRSIWDDFVDTPGAVIDGATTEPGPDSYHRYVEDVSLAHGLGLDRYRFSISWVRVLPEGGGSPNAEGLDYYSRLVDALLEAGVTPFPTLYHWDLPVSIEAAGGWMNRDTALRFRDYTQTVAAHLGDRVKHWYTLNEPAMTTLQGYGIGTLAPGRSELFGALPTAHHQLLAHGLGMAALRDAGAERVGPINNHTFVQPLSDSVEDAMAAGAYDLVHNRIFADPILTGAYPDLEALGLPPMPVEDGDMALISARPDHYGLNFYNPTTVAAAPPDSPLPFDLVPTPGAPVTGFGPEWPIVPQALTSLLVDFRERYGSALPPVIISENGASFPEPATLAPGERIDDADRISYLSGHIEAVAAAAAQGVEIEEYTVWSLLDNFEWADGYTQRFGLVHVDMQTGERTPKASYDWYRRVIEGARS